MGKRLLGLITPLVTTMDPSRTATKHFCANSQDCKVLPRPAAVGRALPLLASLAQLLSPYETVCPVVDLFEGKPHMTCLLHLLPFWPLKKKNKNSHCFEFYAIMTVVGIFSLNVAWSLLCPP